ncbi:MAG: hypothetical protein DKT66_09590 [Candidatus Melainabacteria bacterium]|nr:MAG: hypothetical protein DKT66_09590 [Candidatus Melainabacteria bacterium]
MGQISETVEGRTYTFNRDTVENLTAKAEGGNSISNELNAMDPTTRLAMARAMDRVNAAHRKADQYIPDLVIEEKADQDGHQHLFDMQYDNKLGSDWNPFNKQHYDVYDLPQSVADLNVERSLPASMQSDRWKLILTFDKAENKK